MSEHHGQLSWDRHCSCRSVRPRRLSAAVTVDSVADLELGLFEIAKSRIRPGQREQLREAGAGQSRDGEQRPVRLPRGPDGLLQIGRSRTPVVSADDLAPTLSQHELGSRVPMEKMY
jgi:hypothetical protein